jgi:outer membrane protein OmpA-like peptidoglycan-associated protein
MFKKILVANRGEIAVRVIRACRELGIPSVAVFSDVDRAALHVLMADEAFPIGAAAAAESYLNIAKILEVAKRCGADAIHPGYGFLSENAKFAQASAGAGIKFIGPSAASMEMMGSKTRARQEMEKAGVPFVPGTSRALESVQQAKQVAAKIGYPVMLKAAAGGGGKGMRLVPTVHTKMIKDTDSRAQAGIQLASTKATEADQHAIDAGNKAQMAQQTATQANTRLTTVEQVVGNIDQYKASNQTEIRFRPGQSVLSKNAKAALDDMATPLKDQRGYIVEVQGFSSGRGQAAIATSQKMADAVVRYLVLNHEIPVYRIYVVGMGNAPVPTAATDDPKAKRTSGGRVEVSLLKNDLETLATTTASAPANQDQPVQK